MYQNVCCILILVSTVIMSGPLRTVCADENKPHQQFMKVDVKNKPSDKKWVSRETRTIDMLTGFEPYKEKIDLNSYGGRADRQAASTGFFYPKKVDGRWWLVDPDGKLFIHTAIVGVYTGLSDYSQQSSLEKFGSEAKWAP